MTLNEFSRRFERIKELGFVRSTRQGTTGIGHTLETLLSISENNNAHPDVHGAELKAHRSGSNSMITLFTFNRKVWQMPPLEAVRRYGSLDANGRQGLYYTMSMKPNSAGLFLMIEDKEISVRHISGVVVAKWNLEVIAARFMQKIPALLFVSAFSEQRAGIEYFQFYRAQIMRGTSPELLANQFREGNIFVDLRLHDQVTRARNHGTGFRTFEDRLPNLFQNIQEL